jgi:diguanylate cyclase (GGDEF)-like protein/PAS domain S-box-containing protein
MAPKRAEQLLRLEHTVARCVSEADSASAGLKAAIRAVCEALDWECGRFFRVDEDAGVLRFAEAWAKPDSPLDVLVERSRELSYKPGVGLVGRVWQSGEPMWVPDVTQDARVFQKAIAAEVGMHGSFVFPVNSEGKAIGVLSFSSSEIREPDEGLMQAIRVIGAQIGQFVQRKQAEDVLRESEERFRNLTELSSDWYWEQDENFRFTMFSDNLHRRLGPVMDSLIGKTRWELPTINMSEADWAAHRALLEAHQPFRDLQWHRLDRDGNVQVASISGSPIFDSEGRFRGYRGIGRDITETKRSEEALLRFRASMDMSDDMILLVDRKTMRLLDVNEAVCRNLGYSRAELLEMTTDQILPISREDLARAYDEMIATGATQGMRSYYRCKDGSTLPFESRRRVMRSGDDWIIVATARDIRERIAQEEALLRFRASMDMSDDMILLVDRKTMRFIDVNEAVCRNLGYSRAELLGMTTDQILPISREDLGRAYDEMIATGATQGMRSNYRCKDGSTLPFESRRRVMRSGDSWIIVATARDIRERIKQEEALRKSNERFDMAVRATNDVIWDWDLVTDEIWWNENFTKVFGYERDAVDRTVQSWYQGIHPDDQGRVIAGVHRVIGAGGENWSDEYRFRRMDGGYLHVLDRGHVIRDASGRAVRMIGAMADISSRKEAEERIHSQAMQQRLIAEFGQQAFASTDVEDVIKRAVELVSVSLKTDYTSVLELDRDGKQLMMRAASGWPEEFRSRPVVIRPGGRLEFVLAHREPLIIEDLPRDRRFPDSPLLRLGVRSGIQVPIFGTAGTFGILSAHARAERRFGQADANFLQSVANILAVAAERKNAQDHLERLAQFDSLTGLPNRHLFHDRLLKTMAHARRSGEPMAVLFIDLDRFKLVNDTQGHSAGDKLLQEAATRLLQCVRGGDTVGRFGGDEFGAIVTDLAKPGDAGVVAQKVLDALARPFKLDAHDTYVSASIGITLFPADGDNPEALVMNADTAMYRAKEQGRNTYQYFTREMNERALARVQMEAALRRAIEHKEFLLHYQPKVDLRTRAISGFEALLRWQHGEKGLILPGEFVSVLEDAGLIVQVGEWVLREVCAQIRSWQRNGLPVKPVTVNLSARQFQQKDFEATVRHVLREAGVDPSLVQFELTESLLMSDPEGAARTLRGLKDSGVRISVDDFGTGYSSLAYLRRFPIDSLKIDYSFIRDITTDPEDAMITLAIIGLGHSLRLKVVAEGVETQEQLELLAANGCDEIQGYRFSVPTTPEECANMMRENRRLV